MLAVTEGIRDINAELFESWKDHQPHYLKRNVEYDPRNNVIALLTLKDGFQKPIFGRNLVTDTGELYYTKRIAQEATLSPDFSTDGRMILNNPASADTPAADDEYQDVNNPITDSNKVIDGTYPKRNDDDVDNPGAASNVFTWRTTYAGADFDTEGGNNITGGAILETATPIGTSPILNHWNFGTPFGKLSTSSLVVWVNHTLVGA